MSPPFPDFVSLEPNGPPHDQLLLHGTAFPADVALLRTRTAYQVTSTTLETNVILTLQPPSLWSTESQWDELNLTISSMNFTTMLQPPRPSIGLTELEQNVAVGAGTGIVLVAMTHAAEARNVPPPMANGIFPNWWLGRETNASFWVAHTRNLSCDVLQHLWTSSTIRVNWTTGCSMHELPTISTMTTTTVAQTTSFNRVGNLPLTVSEQSAVDDDDWSRDNSLFNQTVGVSCGIALAAAVFLGLFWAFVSSGSLGDTTEEQRDRQIRRDVQSSFKWNVFPQEDFDNKDYIHRAKATKRRPTTQILREVPYPRNQTNSDMPEVRPPPQYRPPPPANGTT